MPSFSLTATSPLRPMNVLLEDAQVAGASINSANGVTIDPSSENGLLGPVRMWTFQMLTRFDLQPLSDEDAFVWGPAYVDEQTLDAMQMVRDLGYRPLPADPQPLQNT